MEDGEHMAGSVDWQPQRSESEGWDVVIKGCFV